MFWSVLAGAAGIMSLVTFAAYGLDKRSAVRGGWRTRERSLLLLGLAFGWPGGLAAQRLFRHKTRDRVFLVWFWASVVANVAVIAGLVWLFK